MQGGHGQIVNKNVLRSENDEIFIKDCPVHHVLKEVMKKSALIMAATFILLGYKRRHHVNLPLT